MLHVWNIYLPTKLNHCFASFFPASQRPPPKPRPKSSELLGQVSRPRRDGSASGSKSADASPCRPLDALCLGAGILEFFNPNSFIPYSWPSFVNIPAPTGHLGWFELEVLIGLQIKHERKNQENTWVRRDFCRILLWLGEANMKDSWI